MSGNVWERCFDYWAVYPDTSTDYRGANTVDEDGFNRILRV